jgi:hypothetical protein
MQTDSAQSFGSTPGPSLPNAILTVGQLLSDKQLSIPIYQRPYKWTVKNIHQLFADIITHKDKSSYRLGTIVFHQDNELKQIVDGQQRTISLMLAVRALQSLPEHKVLRIGLRGQLNELAQKMVDPSFESETSKANIHRNYLEIYRIVERSDFTEDHIDFLLNRCEVVAFTLADVSEAFQFFDSQNARGRDLEPHDLLKAYHLREFSPVDESLKADSVKQWENSDSSALATLFSEYLYRIRNWSKGTSARYFGKEDTPLFKGINLATVAQFPYVEQLRMAHHHVDSHNRQHERKGDDPPLPFPFHLDQIIINGRRFFEMIAHYQTRVACFNQPVSATGTIIKNETLNGYAAKILGTINTYAGKSRSGDRYVRTIFNCLLIYYIDKFGDAEISRAIEKIFIWSYRLRLTMQVVQLAGMDNYVVENNLFRVVKDANRPSEFISYSLPMVSSTKSTKTEAIEALFRDMRYYE